MADTVRLAIRVEGVVQGVGFRPFVYSLATRVGLSGFVGNDADGVFAQVQGSAPAVREFLKHLESGAPPLARVDRITSAQIPPRGDAGFVIAESDRAGRRRALVSADTATCADCLAELFDPPNRRFGYPFINCTNCGPRFTIVTDVPYDRPFTTMAGFAMCAACAAEYHDPADRRFHAQPVCCPDCGPRLRLLDAAGVRAGRENPAEDDEARGRLRRPAARAPAAPPAPVAGGPDAEVIAAAARRLSQGQVLAVKGIGGYHLAVDAASERAASALRARKQREDKPFAVMAADLAAAAALCDLDEVGKAALTGAARPIVLLPRRPDAMLAQAVAPGNRHLGIMLPYTPLHHLLLARFGRPIVLTSGNVSDEPIAYRDEDAFARLAGIADAFLAHDRAIHTRADDSVVRPLRGRVTMLRRSRGHAPEPVRLRAGFRRPVLACGAELKNTFCLGAEDRAFLSQHIGDLENYQSLQSFTEGIERFRRLFDIEPQVVAHDLHPEYLSTKYALQEAGVELTPVQHHHAHIASCLADNDEDGPVIGVAFDGAGFGSDGTLWGGEFLLADLGSFERAAHLAPVPLPGGAAAIRQPWRMAAVYLDAAFGAGRPDGLAVEQRNAKLWPRVVAMASRGVNAPPTSSAGRLFDAVAALVGVRDVISYEGQAAIELEQVADVAEPGAYPAGIVPGWAAGGRAAPASGGGQGEGPALRQPSGGPGPSGPGPLLVRGADLIRAAAEDWLAGVAPGVISARFHRGVARAIADVCGLLRERSGLATVALSGGVFQNALLLGLVLDLLESAGFRVLTHARVPPNDGGISLGQAAVAAARDRARTG